MCQRRTRKRPRRRHGKGGGLRVWVGTTAAVTTSTPHRRACGLAPLPCRLPRSGAGGEGAFPRVSVHRLRRVNPQALAGQKLSLPPQGQFAEKQPPRRLSGALLFRPFSWACKKKARSKGYFPSSFSDPAWLLFAPYPMLSHPDRESQLRMSDLFSRCSEIRSASFTPAAR